MPDRPVCHHPGLPEPRPEPSVMDACDCGQNAVCPLCGWGWGQQPCECRHTISDATHRCLLEESITRYAELWHRLAQR